MEKIVISLPREIKLEIEEHPEIDWAMIFRKAAKEMLNKLALAEFLDKKLDKSEFTEEDAHRLGELAKQNRLKQLKSLEII